MGNPVTRIELKKLLVRLMPTFNEEGPLKLIYLYNGIREKWSPYKMIYSESIILSILSMYKWSKSSIETASTTPLNHLHHL